jgi:hypothetical protein
VESSGDQLSLHDEGNLALDRDLIAYTVKHRVGVPDSQVDVDTRKEVSYRIIRRVEAGGEITGRLAIHREAKIGAAGRFLESGADGGIDCNLLLQHLNLRRHPADRRGRHSNGLMECSKRTCVSPANVFAPPK